MNGSYENDNRVLGFQRNSDLEDLLSDINRLLSCSEKKAIIDCSDKNTDHPVIFLMGPHRSGSTLFMQWLADSGIVSYPTNLLSRFFGAPVVGAHIQLLLTDSRYNYRDEILDFNSDVSFESENGKTHGALAPNEFWYFWRRFLPFEKLDWLSNEDLDRVVDSKALTNELQTLTRVFDKPFALKSMILNYNIPFLDKIFKKALFIQLTRNPVTNAASILDARKRQHGDERKWYSFKIPEYPALKDLKPIPQVVGQIHAINKAVDAGMSTVSDERKMVVSYEEFCANPRYVFEHLVEKLEFYDGAVRKGYSGPKKFTVSRSSEIKDHSEIIKSISEIEN